MKRIILLLVFTAFCLCSFSQLIYYKEKLASPYTLADKKAAARKSNIIANAEALQTIPIINNDSITERIQSALWSLSQFLVSTPKSDSGIQRLVNNYWAFDDNTQRALLEVLYALYPKKYYTEMVDIMQGSTHPKNFAMAAAYAFRAYPTEATKKLIKQKATTVNCNEGQSLMIYNLLKYIDDDFSNYKLPSIDSLFAHQQVHKFKVIYSFQSFNRDKPGIAIVQNPDGTFARDDSGNIKTFSQLARSASNLPWFISNGSTPQGLYSITGTGFSRNVFIGPTPNLQMVMMNEVNPPTFTHYFPPVFNAPPERLYRSYFPLNWQNWNYMMEAYDAGKIGRSEIIAHGSTIDPEWYVGKPYYPLTPTMGCLCASETWDKKTGKIINSDQLDLVNAFIETPGRQGYLFVINVDEKEVSIDKQQLEMVVKRFETNMKKPALVIEQATQN
ncbi:MAG: hypothetical protein V4717_23925 [Bacteroidota bacterium]